MVIIMAAAKIQPFLRFATLLIENLNHLLNKRKKATFNPLWQPTTKRANKEKPLRYNFWSNKKAGRFWNVTGGIVVPKWILSREKAQH